MIDLSTLNQAQMAAVKDTEGAILVLAGAGSGKTRVLTHRIAYLVEEMGVLPYNILAITFTNKATAEMKERLNKMLGEGNNVFVSTFHSFCSTILRYHADKIGFATNFTIYDETDTAKVIKKVLIEKNLAEDPLKDELKGYISKAKNEGLSPDEFLTKYRLDIKDIAKVTEAYNCYEQYLSIANAMDFDDLLIKTKKLFLEDAEVLLYYQRKFRYIHVDEFQDTNTVQFELIKMLAGIHGNIFVVGDDDQSIYGWRGAKVENILSFDKLFPNTKIHKLLQNYRSTNAILDVANNVIKNNVNRHDKQLFSENGKGTRVEYFVGERDYDEAQYVIDTIRSLKMYSGYRNKEIAILVRANSLTRLFENKLASINISYKVLGGFKFFDRKEIQDIIAYLRFVNNTRDNEAIERIINFPRRGIGETTVESLSSLARSKAIPLIDVIWGRAGEVLKGATLNKIKEFGEIIKDLTDNKDKPVDEFLIYLVDKIGFEALYKSSEKEEERNRWENILEFINHTREFKKTNPKAELSDFLETLTLKSDTKENDYERDNITLATMHAVKGLEYKVVFVIGCEEDTFPSTFAQKEANGIEEERRLMYVACTRAMERLYLTCAKSRFKFNKVMNFMPSRFLNEAKGIKQDSYDILQKKLEINRKASIYNMQGEERECLGANKTYAKPIVFNQKPSISASKDLSGFIAGAKVNHATYGIGTIILVLGNGVNATATVAFPTFGIKKFSLQVAPLTLINNK